MNIQANQTSIAASGTERIGGRLDIRSDALALSHTSAPAPSSAPRSTASLDEANLLNILDPQEKQALAAAFEQTKTPVYSGRGTTIREPSVLGTHLDLNA